jgi:hypothetical protein
VLLGLVAGFQLFGEFLLILAEPTRLVTHVGRFLGKPVGCPLPQLFTQIV